MFRESQECILQIRDMTSLILYLHGRAAAVEEELRGIADKQKFNVDKLVELVKENGEILEKMKVSEGILSGYILTRNFAKISLKLTSTMVFQFRITCVIELLRVTLISCPLCM